MRSHHEDRRHRRTGLVGSQVVTLLQAAGHQPVAAAPQTGVDTLSGVGVDEALAGADVVVDLSNSPSFADDDVLKFFTASTTTLLDAERRAGVGHHVILSIVGADEIPDSGYMRAKVAQEELVKDRGTGWSIVRATQFLEFVPAIAAGATDESGVAHVAPVDWQPIASADVARLVAEVATGEPLDGTIEIAGPVRGRFDELVRDGLRARGDEREVVADPGAPYFGTRLWDGALVPRGQARLGTLTLDDVVVRKA